MARDRDLPVVAVLPELLAALDDPGAAVLVAPPGSGKSTVVPTALAAAPWCDGRVVVLEPRRVAARAVAERIASGLDEPVGRTVGLRMRGETRTSAGTTVEIVTEGVLGRMVQSDPALAGVAAVVYDELHERSIHTDLGLALTVDVRRSLRPDLRVLAMSATLDARAVAGLLDGAPIVQAAGRMFPVVTRWEPPRPGTRTEAATAQAVGRALGAAEGDVLVFLPGVAEIRRTHEALGEISGIDVVELHGGLDVRTQGRVLRPGPRRRVVLSTALAETSLTVPGVRVVVDAGLARVPRHDPRRGLTTLTTVAVSQAGADQRRGRAGRTAPGFCIRLWDEIAHASRPAARSPEIVDADLTDLVLALACWGVTDPVELAWLDLPPAGSVAAARAVLLALDAVDDEGRPTPRGRRIAGLGTHPRLGAMIDGVPPADRGLACDLAALLGEPDLRRGPLVSRGAAVTDRLRLLSEAGPGPARRVAETARRLRRQVGAAGRPGDGVGDRAGRALALAYPDRVGRRRPNASGHYLLANGTGVAVASETDPLAGAEVIVAADVAGRDGPGDDLIALGAALDLTDVEDLFVDRISTEDVVGWDTRTGDVVARRRRLLGQSVLADGPLPDADPAALTAALVAGVRAEGLELLPWTARTRARRDRVALCRRVLGEPWPDLGDEALLADLEAWLTPHLAGRHRRSDLARVDLDAALTALLPWPQPRQLDELAPSTIDLPGGRSVPVDYGAGDQPVVRIRVQDAFGTTDTPSVVGGRVPVLLHLLSPAGRPVQVTADLATFWADGYRSVRAEMRGRYPKHHWPEDPAHAAPSRATGRRRPS